MKGLAVGLWTSFTSQLQKMEETKEIDLSIIPIIEELMTDCQDNENWWANNNKERIENNFAPYHAFRNLRLILKMIKEKLETAKERHSNPIEAENTLSILPTMLSLYDFAFSLKDKQIDNNIKTNIYLRSRYLRDLASSYSFLPTLKEEVTGITKSRLKIKISQISLNASEHVDLEEGESNNC